MIRLEPRLTNGLRYFAAHAHKGCASSKIRHLASPTSNRNVFTFNPLLIETPFNAFANRTNPDQAALSGFTLFAYGNMIRYDPSLMDLATCVFTLLVTVLHADTLVDTQLPGSDRSVRFIIGDSASPSHSGSASVDDCEADQHYKDILNIWTRDPCMDSIQVFKLLASLERHRINDGAACVTLVIRKMAEANKHQSFNCSCPGHIYKHNYPNIHGHGTTDCKHSDNHGFQNIYQTFYQERRLTDYNQERTGCRSQRYLWDDLNSIPHDCQLNLVKSIDYTYTDSPSTHYRDYCNCKLVSDGPNSISFSPAQTSFTVTEGSQLDVTCMADCHPNCTYRWYYSYSHSHGSHSQGVWIDSSRFHMRHADFHLAGTYTCKATNPQTHHEYRKYFTLHVVAATTSHETTSTTTTKATAETTSTTSTKATTKLTTIQSTLSTTSKTVPVAFNSCAKLSTIQDIAQRNAATHPNASLCPSGDKRSSDAFVLVHCTVPSNPTNWIQGDRVMDLCNQIPLYTPVATFYNGRYSSSGGVSGVFLGCLQNGFKLGVQECGRDPTTIYIVTGGVFTHDPSVYYSVQ